MVSVRAHLPDRLSSAPVGDVGASRPHPVYLAIFYCTYVLAGGLGQGLAIIPGVSITFWPPAGVFLATLLLNARATWSWWFLVGGLAELSCNWFWFHNPVWLASVYFGANTLEAVTAAWLVTAFLGSRFRLETLEEVVAFIGLGAGIAPTVGATAIASIDALLGKHEFATAWLLVWLGDSSGLLISTPLTFVAVQVWRQRHSIAPPRWVEAGILCALLLAACALGFEGYLPTAYVTMPPLLWAAVRFQFRGAATAMGLITLATAAYTMRGQGEFTGEPDILRQRIVMLQTFLAISAVSALMVAALSQQYQEALLSLRAVNAELEQRVCDRTANLQAVERELRDAAKRKDEFLATLAHELRNPLAPVRNAVQLLQLKGIEVPELKWARDVIDRQMQSMARLIDDLMDVSRINLGKMELKRSTIRLSEIIQSAIETSRPLIEQMEHQLIVDIPQESIWLNGDLTRLTQVFLNLLNNAAKYMESGGRIEVRAEKRDEHVFVSVKDYGIGIPADKLSSIFDMFSQVEGTLTRSQGGLGIGLCLVKRLVEMHGGNIEVKSDGIGMGCELVVCLPVLPPAQAHSPQPSDTLVASQSPNQLRILVVDDNRDAAESLSILLRILGNTVCQAHDGFEALQAAEDFQPHVVLCDIGLPKLNGYEVCRRIRGHTWGQDMLLVAITGWGQDADKRKSADAGFDHHMVKPVDPQALLKLIGSSPINVRAF